MRLPPLRLTRDSAADRALTELDRLTRQLERLLVRAWKGDDAAWDDVINVLRDVDYNQADARVASQIVGMLSPWIPEAQDNPQGRRQVDLAIRGLDDVLVPRGGRPTTDTDDRYRYPGMEDAVKFITDRRIVTASELSGLTAEEKSATFSAPGINSPGTLSRLKALVADSLNQRDSLSDFRKKAREVVELEKHQEETLYRTETKRAYLDGLDRTLERPKVREKFPYVRLSATRDNRVRDHHWDMDGFIVEVGTNAHEIFKKILREYNCRCTPIALTEEQAVRMGGPKSIADFPESVKRQYNL